MKQQKIVHSCSDNILYSLFSRYRILLLVTAGIFVIIILYDLIMGYGPSLQFNSIWGRSVHFVAITCRLIFVVFCIFVLFIHMFGSQLRNIVFRLLKNKFAVGGFIILNVLMLLAVYADYIADYNTIVIKQDLSNTFASPSANAFLGTDEFGRNIAARIVHGTRISLVIGFISVGLSIIVGGFLGSLAGYFGGWIDNVIMRIMDIFLAIPSILLAIAIVAALGSSLLNLVIALSISSIPVYARIVRASVLSVRSQEFIEAAHAIGAGHFYIILKHVIPNVLSPIIVQGTLGIAGTILSIAGLSFIGLGVQPPIPEWGSMLAGGRNFIRRAPWVTTFPGIAIMLSILSLNLLGDGLRDALDPRLK